MTSIGLTGQLYRNAKTSNLNFMVQMSKEFSISSYFESITVINLHTIWWPQLHSTYHRPQVSSIWFMRFLWAPSDSYNCFCWHAIQLVFLPHIVPLRGKRLVYCCFVNLWSMSIASSFWFLVVSCEDRSPTLIPRSGIMLNSYNL